MDQITVDQLHALRASRSVAVLDVRTPQEWASGHVPGALNIPLAIVPLRHTELGRGDEVYVICESGARSAQASLWLRNQGYNVINVMGGTAQWRSRGFAVETGSSF